MGGASKETVQETLKETPEGGGRQKGLAYALALITTPIKYRGVVGFLRTLILNDPMRHEQATGEGFLLSVLLAGIE